MPARSPALALVLLGACFTDAGAPATATGSTSAAASTAAASTAGPEPTTAAETTAQPASSTGEASTQATTADIGGTSTTAAGTDTDTDTGCTPMPWYFDFDKDGFGGPQSVDGCGPPPAGYTAEPLDCDDNKSAINPDAEELCDGVDNDCDTGVDEYPAGSAMPCNGCRGLLAPDATYYLCATPLRDWDSARAHCKTLLGDLIVVDDDAEHIYIRDQVLGFKARWWIGLSDAMLEGQFVWVDGTPLDPAAAQWGNGEPNNGDTEAPGPANCAAMLPDIFPPGAWRDQVCSNLRATICEAPGF